MAENILISGASSEIGLAIARRFNKAGNNLFLQCFSNKKKLEEQTSNFIADVKIFSVNFLMSAELDYFISDLKNITVFINAAAIIKADLLVNLSDDDMQKMLMVNDLVPAKICRALIPQMIVKRNGCIVNITSITASRGNRGQSVYAGTKGFLEAFTRSLAAEYGMKGIRANCVSPGAIDAGNTKGLLRLAPDEVKKSVSSGRLGTSDDVASLVHYLCSADASFINGQTLHVDGGFQQGV
jgi:3-oxoacyl-[acyl-carrier protein] reductase